MSPRSSKRRRIRTPQDNGSRTVSNADRPAQDHCPALQLPIELLQEIFSHFPTYPLAASHFSHKEYQVLPETVLERSDTLRALSQTCKAWRKAFFPILWETIEVSAVRSSDNTANKANKSLSVRLQRKGEGIVREPEIANLVREMRVVLVLRSKEAVIPAFANCLGALPNLKTVSILSADLKMTAIIKDTFDGHCYPQIETVVLPTHAYGLLRCCPNAKTVICNGGDGSQLITVVKEICPKVEFMEGLTGVVPHVKRLVAAAPNLHEIRFRIPPFEEAVTLLGSLRHLRHIGFGTHGILKRDAETILRGVIDAATVVLRKNSSVSEPCTLVISSRSPRLGWSAEDSLPWTKVLRILPRPN